jgi:hypothetical protein
VLPALAQGTAAVDELLVITHDPAGRRGRNCRSPRRWRVKCWTCKTHRVAFDNNPYCRPTGLDYALIAPERPLQLEPAHSAASPNCFSWPTIGVRQFSGSVHMPAQSSACSFEMDGIRA